MSDKPKDDTGASSRGSGEGSLPPRLLSCRICSEVVGAIRDGKTFLGGEDGESIFTDGGDGMVGNEVIDKGQCEDAWGV